MDTAPIQPQPVGAQPAAEVTKTLEDILCAKGVLTAQQVQDIRLEHINTGSPIEQLIISRHLAEPLAVSQAKADLLGMEFVRVQDVEIPSFVLDFIPETLATRYGVLPFKEEGATLSVAMIDPLDLQVIAILEKKSGMRIKPYLGDPEEIKNAVQQQYSKALGSEVSEALKEVNASLGDDAVTHFDLADTTDVSFRNLKNAPVARIVGNILQYAVRSHSSDVHIEASEEHTRVRYRIDGVLQDRLTLPRSVHESLLSRIKILSNLKIDEKRVPQDGRFKIEVGHIIVDLRVSTLPTVYGEKVVMRLLEGTGHAMEIKQLGLRGDALKRFEENLARTVGLILVTGPTGSGKTNTLAAALARVNTPKVNIVTLEDPVEVRIPGVNQVQINPTAGLTFSSGLRSILRQDPNIIMVGEIRDFETAELAIHAALTGHLVLSTLHTKSSAGSLPRLYDMKVEPFLLASTVNLVVAQRLVRTLCTHCRVQRPVTDAEKADIATVLGKLVPSGPDALKLFSAPGCTECNGMGYVGRIGIFEVMSMTSRLGDAVISREPDGTLHDIAVADGMVTLIQDGYLKALDGITTLEEVLRVARD